MWEEKNNLYYVPLTALLLHMAHQEWVYVDLRTWKQSANIFQLFN